MLSSHPLTDNDFSSAGFEELFLDKQLCLSLSMATNAVARTWGRLLAEFDITFPQVLTLMSLWEIPKQTVGDLGHRLGLDSATMSPLLKRLEANGYVIRKRDTTDVRRVYVKVTKKGLDLRQTIMQLRRDMLCAIDMPAESLETTRLNLFKITQKMSEMLPPKRLQRQQHPRQRRGVQTTKARPSSSRPASMKAQ